MLNPPSPLDARIAYFRRKTFLRTNTRFTDEIRKAQRFNPLSQIYDRKAQSRFSKAIVLEEQSYRLLPANRPSLSAKRLFLHRENAT